MMNFTRVAQGKVSKFMYGIVLKVYQKCIIIQLHTTFQFYRNAYKII